VYGISAASLIVVAAILTSRIAGPVAAGTVAAFPTMTMALVVAVVVRGGSTAGAQLLVGLVRSLPCYLTFCLVIVLALPALGLPAVGVALIACAWLAELPGEEYRWPRAGPKAIRQHRHLTL
jgi:hypothetical protein